MIGIGGDWRSKRMALRVGVRSVIFLFPFFSLFSFFLDFLFFLGRGFGEVGVVLWSEPNDYGVGVGDVVVCR